MSSVITARKRMTFALLAIIGAGLPLAGQTTKALAKDIIVPVDEAILVRLDKQASDVIIGNPSIADVSVQNGRLLVVTGKTFGITNIIILDSQGQEILSEKVHVQTDQKRLVRVFKGKSRASYDCAPRCETALMPGDADGHFEALQKEITGKMGIAQTAVDGGQSAQ